MTQLLQKSLNEIWRWKYVKKTKKHLHKYRFFLKSHYVKNVFNCVYLGCKNAIQTIFSKTFQKTRCIRNDSKVFNKQYKQNKQINN